MFGIRKRARRGCQAASKQQEHQGQGQGRGWEGFTYFGVAENHATPDTNSNASETKPVSSAEKSYPLAMAEPGERVVVVGFRSGERAAHRLTSMGLAIGKHVETIGHTPSGSTIVAIDDNRIGLGAGMAHKVMVSKANEA
jgi:ferrous iron transport protein A